MPFYWVGMHLILIYIYFIFSPGYKIFTQEVTAKSGIFRFRTETLLLWIHFVVSLLGYILAMVFRFRSLIALTLSSSSDPHLSYLFWTISIYILIQKSLIKAHDNYYVEFLNLLFNTNFTFDDRVGTWIFAIQKLYIMLSVRFLFHSNCMLLFELKFLSTFSIELKEYLEKYLQLRTFNLAWLSHVQKQSKQKSDKGRSIKQIAELLATIDPTKKLQPKEENFSKLNAETFSFFRQKNTTGFGCFKRRDSKDYDDIFLLKNIALIGTKKEQLYTWNAIQYIVKNPPCISLIGNNVKLTDSTSIKLACNTLFIQIGETCELYKQSGDTDFVGHPDRDFTYSSSDFLDRNANNANLMHFGDSDTQLNLDTIIKFMPTETAIKFINSYDLAGHGYINLHMFMRNVAGITKLRTDLINNLLNQKSVVALVQRLIYAILWLIMLVFAGFVVRINSNIVLPSTIGIISTAILALSYLYTKFITAIIFVVLSCPYHVGDRVRVNDSEPMFVKKIRTYTTEFQCIHGKVIIYQNANLSNMIIINETRSNPAFLQFNVTIGAAVNAAVLKALKQNISDYVSSRPMEFVKNSCDFFGRYLEPGHLYRLTIRAQCTRGWVEACTIGLQHRSLCDFIMHQCKVLGITYHAPQRNIRFSTPLSITK